jgi:hypothetical protein
MHIDPHGELVVERKPHCHSIRLHLKARSSIFGLIENNLGLGQSLVAHAFTWENGEGRIENIAYCFNTIALLSILREFRHIFGKAGKKSLPTLFSGH